MTLLLPLNDQRYQNAIIDIKLPSGSLYSLRIDSAVVKIDSDGLHIHHKYELLPRISMIENQSRFEIMVSNKSMLLIRAW